MINEKQNTEVTPKKETIVKKIVKSPLTFTKYIVTSFTDPIVSQGKESKGRLLQLCEVLNPFGALERAKARSHNETYEQAKTRLKVTETDIDRNYRNFVTMFYLVSFFTFAFWLGGLYSLATGQILTGLVFFSLSTIHIANGIKYSFYAWQVRRKELSDFKSFKSALIENPYEFIPPSNR